MKSYDIRYTRDEFKWDELMEVAQYDNKVHEYLMKITQIFYEALVCTKSRTYYSEWGKAIKRALKDLSAPTQKAKTALDNNVIEEKKNEQV